MQEVVTLQELVGKLGERQTVASLAVETTLYGIFRHHIVDGDMLADFASEVEKRETFHPVVVVDEFGGVGRIRVEVEKFRQLSFDASLIVAQSLFGEEVALSRLTRRVANHTGSTADKGDGFMPATLEVAENHDTHQVSDMQRVGSRVDAHVSRCHFFFELFFRARHHVVNHAAPFEFFYEIHIYCQLLITIL